MTPHPIRITQNDDHVVFEWEEYGGRRVVYFGDELPPAGPKTHLGDSIARYDGDALIIETVNLLGNPANPRGNPLSDQTTTVETYRRADDSETGPVLEMTMAITDPGIPVHQAAEMIATLSHEIPDAEKRIEFKKSMMDILNKKRIYTEVPKP